MDLTKSNLFFMLMLIGILGYTLSNALLLYLNGYGVAEISHYYDLRLIPEALKQNYPYVKESLAASFAAAAALVLLIVFFPKKQPLHGSARFAKTSEIFGKMKLNAKKGVIIGKKGSRLLRIPGQHFVAVAAPTGTGKGTSIVIPNLLDWEESCVVLDIKQENYAFFCI